MPWLVVAAREWGNAIGDWCRCRYDKEQLPYAIESNKSADVVAVGDSSVTQ